MNRVNKYVLDGDGNAVPCDDVKAWAAWLERNNKDRQIAVDEIDGVTVSTVFIGLDQGGGEGPPILWETMVFGREHADYQKRYSSRDDALAGHAQALATVKGRD
jgi:hypothetical protein